MDLRNFIYLCAIFSIMFYNTDSSLISSMFQGGYISPDNVLGLSPKLRSTILNGTQLAIDTCKIMFKWDRWNCSQMAFTRQIQQTLTREVAFIQAIMTAGLIHAITKSCSTGKIAGCSCNKNTTGLTRRIQKINDETSYLNHKIDWTWSGCSDDVTFAEQIFERHFDVQKKNNDAQAFITRHNFNIGRQVVQNSFKKKCVCNVVSNKCNFKTCWLALEPFEEIAEKLRYQYQRAVHVSFHNAQNGVNLGNSAHYLNLNVSARNKLKKLIYLTDSPNYCVPSQNGWPGTLGRQCSRTESINATRSEKQSCYNLCRSCGYKVKRQERRITTYCDCVFVWCCRVECNVCYETVTDHFCV